MMLLPPTTRRAPMVGVIVGHCQLEVRPEAGAEVGLRLGMWGVRDGGALRGPPVQHLSDLLAQFLEA